MAKSDKFYELISRDRETNKVNSLSMDKAKYELLINKVKNLKSKSNKDGNDYRFLKRYNITEIKGTTKLISPVPEDKKSFKYFVHDEELFEVLNEAHIITGHARRDRMVKHLKAKYKNITYKDIIIYLSICEACSQKQKYQKKSAVVKSTPIKDMNHKCQVELIDFRSKPDGDYKFILVYQDLLTQFMVLKPLRTDAADEICDNLIDIFTLFGATSVFQSGLGRGFVDKIISKLVDIWPELKIAQDKPGQDESKGNAEGNGQDLENALNTWMKCHRNSRWSHGLKFVQLMKNSSLRNGEMKSPYEVVFGCQPKYGLASSGISIVSEEVMEPPVGRIKVDNENKTKEWEEWDTCPSEGPAEEEAMSGTKRKAVEEDDGGSPEVSDDGCDGYDDPEATSLRWLSTFRVLESDQMVIADVLITQVLAQAYFNELTPQTKICDIKLEAS